MITSLLKKELADKAEIQKMGYYYLIEILLTDDLVIPVIASDIKAFFDTLYESNVKFIHAYWGMRIA